MGNASVAGRMPSREALNKGLLEGPRCARDDAPTTPTTSEWLADRAHGAATRGAVLLHAPAAAFQAPGGGENQLVQTGKALEDLGVSVRPFSPWTDQMQDFRLLHLFGMSREGLGLARVARRRGVPVVLSPICWFEPRAISALAPSRLHCAWEFAKWSAMVAVPRRPGWRGELLGLADAILPNSRAESDQLGRLFGVDRRSIRVVPNGVQPRFARSEPSLFRARFGEEPFVLYVGRIEPRKNVLGLIHAVQRADHPLVVIGDAVPGHEGYHEACRREGRGIVRWLPRVEHDDPLLSSAYAAARVFALPSWFETPGLAALEAALAGCPVVITPFGCTREYFEHWVFYARPDRPSAIARAIAEAWDAPPRAGLAAHVGTQFSWSEVAIKTAEAYDRVAG
jgi:glycosyltransferase involved in cell wall biosynthesis